MGNNKFENNDEIEDLDAYINSFHTHEHSHGEYTHTHEHIHNDENHTHSGHSHSHFHSAEEKKRQINRLAKVIGHLQHVKLMIENDEDCADVLMQLSASKSALNGLGKEIINEHISHCIYHAIEDGDMDALEEFQKAIKKFF